MKALLWWRSRVVNWAQQSRHYNGESFFRASIDDMLLRSRIILRSLISKTKPRFREDAFASLEGLKPPVVRRVTFLSRCLKRWVIESQAAVLRRQAARSFFAGARLPMLGLTGVCLINKPTLVTGQEELESVCVQIRELLAGVSQAGESICIPAKDEIKLKDLELGRPLGKGSNAVVYSARWREEKCDENNGNLPITVDNSERPAPTDTWPNAFLTEGVKLSQVVKEEEPMAEGHLDLAVKVLFNYDASSNASAIWNALHKECLPARVNTLVPKGVPQKLPPHPNVVQMPAAFVDKVAVLPGALQLWPNALSPRLHPQGYGRNATLYLVMHRYSCSLDEFLSQRQLGAREKLSLLCQLLEGVAHLSQHGIAHRDLKSNNLLLDLSQGKESPHLAIGDFGSCLAQNGPLAMILPYQTDEVCRGGNAALMAPEVATARPGPLSWIDYSRADVWAVGAIAYQIYGGRNPFYQCLDSRSYTEDQLPPMPPGTPSAVEVLVRHLLSRNPKKRPSASLAATVCQLLLWGPLDLLLCPPQGPQVASRILRWLRGALVVCLRRPDTPQLLRTLLTRVTLAEVTQALHYFRSQSCTLWRGQ